MRAQWSVILLALACSMASLSAGAQLRTRDPQAQPAAVDPSVAPNVIPEGKTFLVTLDDKIDTRKLEVGKHFKAKLAEDLVAADGSMIPRGRKIVLHVSDYNRGLHGRLLLSFDRIETQHGWVPLIATVTGVPGEHGVVQKGNEGEISRRGVDKTRAVEAAAIGAAAGAATGAAVGGLHGAAIGAVAGGGLGVAGGILTDRDLRLDKGTNLEVRLDRDLQVPTH